VVLLVFRAALVERGNRVGCGVLITSAFLEISGHTQMCTPALPNPIPAVEAARLNLSATRNGHVQHLRPGFLVALRVTSDTWKVLDCGLERPFRKYVRDGVRALVCG